MMSPVFYEAYHNRNTISLVVDSSFVTLFTIVFQITYRTYSPTTARIKWPKSYSYISLGIAWSIFHTQLSNRIRRIGYIVGLIKPHCQWTCYLFMENGDFGLEPEGNLVLGYKGLGLRLDKLGIGGELVTCEANYSTGIRSLIMTINTSSLG